MQKILKHGWPLKSLFFAALIVPLQSTDGWKILSFKKIAAHTVQFSDAGLSVRVKNSAAPLIYKFNENKLVSEIIVKGRYTGLLKFSGLQGEKKNDDFALRIGLVVRGDKKLNFMQRAIAPQWVLELHKLAPKDEGIDRIEFFVAANNKQLLGKKRQHPLSDLLIENFVWLLDKNGDFQFSYKLEKPIDAAALWLAIDGDDTKSEFSLEISSLQLL
jgi:hypothetical protein